MRLLKRKPNGDFDLATFNNTNIPSYAILSHTWGDEEVTYDELVTGAGKNKPGYDKIRFCGERAAADKLEYFWVDTCCIKKTDQQELQTAINSMFRWYQQASKCYVYLTDVHVPDDVIDPQTHRITWEGAFRRSRWFTRGWTLQELIAPATVEFFSGNGKSLGTKVSLELEVQEITKVPVEALRGQQTLSQFSEEERMKWAANRQTTYPEDKVYCLLGIFDVFLPLIYGEGEEYAAQRLRREIQLRSRQNGEQVGEGSQKLSASSLLPFSRNKGFVGREDQLRTLGNLLVGQDSHQRMAIFGLGGCGKSALAIEFAYRVMARYSAYLVFWVPAISRETFELAYRDIGVCLQIPGITDDNADVLQLVKRKLESGGSGNWLMIVDNADDAETLLRESGSDSRRLNDYLPRSDRGTIVFTTRSRKAAVSLAQNNIIKLGDMDQTEGRQLMAQRLSDNSLLEDEAAVDDLLKILEYLPLAVVQATAFINSNDISIADYISLFKEPSAEASLFSKHFEDPSRYREMESTIAKTWYISFGQIVKKDRLAADYLCFMACIDRVNIPQSLLAFEDLLHQIEAIGTLKGYAFITERQKIAPRPGEDKFYDMHRLVQMASMWWLREHGEWTKWTSEAAARLKKLIPFGEHEGRGTWTAYLSHAIHLTGLHDALDDITKASLLYCVGACQKELGQYQAAETSFRHTLAISTRSCGPEHINTLNSRDRLGAVLRERGKYEEAETMTRETLAIREKVYGLEDPSTLVTMNNLAAVFSQRGKYGEAEVMYRQILAIQETLSHEQDHLLRTKENLAAVLMNQGSYEAAEVMFKLTLEIRQKNNGLEHPSTLPTMSNLSSVLRFRGKYEEAEVMFRQLLVMSEKLLGNEHPKTIYRMRGLAAVLKDQYRYEQAEVILRQTLEIQVKVLGMEHPDTLSSMNSLALVLCDQRQYREAEAMQRQALEGREKVLGVDHPDTLTSMGILALILGGQGKYDEAEEMNRRCLAKSEQVRGKDHPDTLTYVSNLAILMADQHRYEESASLYERACAGRDAVLGPDHPKTQACRRNYATMLENQKQHMLANQSRTPQNDS
ncbi:TPR-like protein [Microthyrium microscopicum]|uniref:TPR-like protein n=1 Tax=Microthyrium microscopicum TaxID=703497 RepID=A0A6A6U2Y6_9PEZI|nr:TPR-like protein [Microthyrium microscopicum]